MKRVGNRGTINTSVKYSSLSINEMIILTTDKPTEFLLYVWRAGIKPVKINFFQYQIIQLDAKFDGESDFDIKRGVKPRFD